MARLMGEIKNQMIGIVRIHSNLWWMRSGGKNLHTYGIANHALRSETFFFNHRLIFYKVRLLFWFNDYKFDSFSEM